MAGSDLIQLLQGGPWVSMLGFMIWDRTQQRKLDRERIEADLQAARAMTNLAAEIRGMKS